MTDKERYQKVQLLKAGQIVEIANDWFQAVKVDRPYTDSPCEICELDSICRGDVFDVCVDMETLESHYWYLKLAHP